MNQNSCPLCGECIAAEQINLQEGVALCTACGQLSRLSEVVGSNRPLAEILAKQPRGCSISSWSGETQVLASMRSFGSMIGALAIALFWNGIVSVFVLIALAGLYVNLIGPLPAWFPAPNMDDQMSLGMTLFLCVFLIPFLVIGSGMVGAVVLYAAGKVEAQLGDREAQIRTGIGPFVWKHRFDPRDVRKVGNGQTSWENNGHSKELIVIEADRKIKFGSLLPEERREWLRAVLHALLVGPDKQRQQVLDSARSQF